MTIWSRFTTALRWIWDVILIPYNLVFNRGPIRAYRRAHGGDVAATIAFNAMLSIVPLLLLLVAIAGRFLRNDDRLDSAINQVSQFLPEGQSREAIDTLLTAREQSTTIGIISLVGLIWIGTSFVTTLARAMDRIYRVPERNFFNNRIRALAVVLVFGLLLFASVLFAAVPTYFANEGVPEWIRDHVPSGYISLVISYGVSVFSGIMLFGILHYFLPNTEQGVLDIWPGVIAAAISFTGLTQVFPIYLQLTTNLSTYGAVFGVIWLLLTWFLAIAHILVISTLINAWNFRRRRRREFERNLAHRSSHV